MREGHASRTVEHNALFRALESALPESRRLFKDPLAPTRGGDRPVWALPAAGAEDPYEGYPQRPFVLQN
jgi:hypothetical protein